MLDAPIEGFRLSPQQIRLWRVRNSGRSAYRAQCLLPLEGTLDVARLCRSLHSLEERHEILRTTYKHIAGIEPPLQVIGDAARCCPQEIDISNLPRDGQAVGEMELFHALWRSPFDLAETPVMRAWLIRKNEVRAGLLLSLPAMAADAVTLSNLSSELACLYEGGMFEAFEEEPIQYSDTSEWQNELLENPPEGARECWQSKMSGWTPLQLPGRLHTRVGDFNPEELPFTVGSQLLLELDDLCRRLRVSRLDMLFGCWQLLLWRHTESPDLFVGLCCDGRKFGPLQKAVGLFAKYVPVVVHADNGAPFSKFIASVREEVYEAQQWQEYFSWDLAAGQKNQPNDQPPSFAFVFDFTEAGDSYAVERLSWRFLRQRVCLDRFEVKLSALSGEGSCKFKLEYDRSVYSAQIMDRLADQYKTLLTSVVKSADMRIGSLCLLSEAERRQLLVGW